MRRLPIILLFVNLAACATAEPPPAEPDEGPPCRGACDFGGGGIETQEYEYIVVGSGAGGGPLASNLARAGHSVLLLEAGTDVGNRLTYQVPAFHTLSTEDATMRWDYFVNHYSDPAQAARDSKMVWNDDGTPRGVLYPRAGTLGGCTSHNALITVTPHDSDWQGIADMTGDASWAPNAMHPYFEAIERNGYLDAGTPGHGFGGWLSVERADSRVALVDFRIQGVVKGAIMSYVASQGTEPVEGFFDSIDELFNLMNHDVNAPGAGEGIYTIPLATSRARRNGTRERILSTVDQRFPLTVRMQSLVTNVVFADEPAEDGTPRAVGVDFLDGRSLYGADPRSASAVASEPIRVRATREVILSAGAFNTPQLLMLSGIGPRDQLEAHGIDVRVESPGVGKNLQDRYEVGMVTELDGDLSSTRNCRFMADNSRDRCLEDWQRGRGPYTANGGIVTIVKRSRVAEERGLDPDLFIFSIGSSFRGYYPGYAAETTRSRRAITWAILKGHTENQAGEVTLRSADPRDTPIIDFNYFEEGTTATGEDVRDLEAMVEGVEMVRDIIQRTDDQLFMSMRETVPGRAAVSTRTQIQDFVRNEAWGHHASCTARMGADGDPMAVLDSRFRVRGTTGLRVVDASVFPRIPGFFIVTPVYMISEKASRTILEDAGDAI